MPASDLPTLDALGKRARALLPRAYAPFSGRPAAAVLLLSDGRWVPGVRVESASFSLTIPALLAAYATARAAGRADVRAAALTRPFRPAEHVLLEEALDADAEMLSPQVVRVGAGPLPAPAGPLDPFLAPPGPGTPQAGIALARVAARRAHVPASHFPVGCVIVTEDGRLVPGANVEHPDWSRTLCAERTALATLRSYAAGAPHVLYLTCLHDAAGSPCGACRQLLAEQAPDLDVWMDRGEAQPPERAAVRDLLPGPFGGPALRHVPDA